MGGSEPSEPSGPSGLSVLWSLRTLKIAQGALRAAQSCSESLRAAQSRPERSLGAVRGTAQGRTERAQSCSAPLRIARCVPRATQSRSGSPCALRAAQSLLVAACARSEPAQDRLHLCVRICSSKKLFDKAVSGLLHSAFLNSVLLSSVNVYSRVHTSIYIYIYILV